MISVEIISTPCSVQHYSSQFADYSCMQFAPKMSQGWRKNCDCESSGNTYVLCTCEIACQKIGFVARNSMMVWKWCAKASRGLEIARNSFVVYSFLLFPAMSIIWSKDFSIWKNKARKREEIGNTI